jgi:hypothetical protein
MDGNALEKCPACGSADIVRNIAMSQAVERWQVGSREVMVSRGKQF